MSFNRSIQLSVGVEIERSFEPMQRQVESWRQTQITDAQVKLIFYSDLWMENRRAEEPAARDAPHVHVRP